MNPAILVISNKYDFTTDYICLRLRDGKTSYVRLNRDEFDKYDIGVFPNESLLRVMMGGYLLRFENRI